MDSISVATLVAGLLTSSRKIIPLALRLTGLLRELLDVALRHPPHRRAQQEPEWPGGGQSHVLLPQIRTAAVTHPAGTVIKIPFSLLPSNISLLSQELISKSGN